MNKIEKTRTESIVDFLADYEDIAKRKRLNLFPDNDYYTYAPGETITIAATSGIGKTTIAISIIVEQIKNGRKVAYFSFEEHPGLIIKRMLSGGLELQEILEKFWVFDATDNMQLGDVLENQMQEIADSGYDLIVIDQLSLIEEAGAREMRDVFVKWQMRMITFMTRNKIALLQISQLNRATYQQNLPTVANISESNRINENSKLTILLDADQNNDKEFNGDVLRMFKVITAKSKYLQGVNKHFIFSVLLGAAKVITQTEVTYKELEGE